MKILRLGDPHVKTSNLEESNALLTFVSATARKEKVDRIELLGDLFHTHAVLRLEVVRFWEYWLDRLSDEFETVVLEGNHDQSGDYSSDYSALTIYKRLGKPKLHIITEPTLFPAIAYLPYMHDGEKFIEAANNMAILGASILVCHQTIMGSRYESGIYAHDGIDSERISKNIIQIVSGHIHTNQEFGRIDYPGTARWDSISDTNLNKGIWLYEYGNGNRSTKKFISTEGVCSPLLLYRYEEGGVEPVIPAGARATVEFVGTSAWVTQEKAKYKGKVKIQTQITDLAKPVERESGSNFEDFLNNHFVSKDKDSLIKLAREMGIV